MTSTVPASLTRTAEGAALQAVLLDMDGTLVDTEGFWWDVEKEVFADLGHGLEEPWRDVVVGGPMTRSARLPHRRHRCGHHPGRADRAAQRPLREAHPARRAPDAGRRAAARRAVRVTDSHRARLGLAPPDHRPGAGLGRPPPLRTHGHAATRSPAPSRTPSPISPPPRASAPTRGAARSSRTPRPGWPRPRRRGAGSWPYRPWHPSHPPRDGSSSGPSKRSTSPSCGSSSPPRAEGSVCVPATFRGRESATAHICEEVGRVTFLTRKLPLTCRDQLICPEW